MKKMMMILTFMMFFGCAHKQLKAPKKAPCDFEKQQLEQGFEDNTK